MGKETISPFSPDYNPRPCDESCIRALINLWQDGGQEGIFHAQVELEIEKNKPKGQKDHWQIYLLTEALQRGGFPTAPDCEKKASG